MTATRQTSRQNKAFTIERAAGAIFGLPTYGVHMTAYENEVTARNAHGHEDEQKRVMKVWVPERALSKSTYPGYLDNVSGDP